MDNKEEYQSLLELYKQHIKYDELTEGAQAQFWADIRMCSKDHKEYDLDGLKGYVRTTEPKEVFDEIVKEAKKKVKISIKKEKKEEENVIYTSFVEDGNKIYEQIKDNLYIDAEGKTYSEIYIDLFKYMPIVGEELEREIVMLPTKTEDYKDIPTLIEEIKTFIHKYYDFEDHHLLFSSWYVLLTWVYDRLNTINYLRALGDFGTGKTRFKETVGRICYKPIVGSGAGSIAALKRMVDKWKGTVLTDEGDFKDDDEKGALVKFYNLGFEKGQCIYQCDKNDPNKIDFFDPFCPKIILTRKTFKDQALESRCLTHITKTTNRKDIPIILGDSFFAEQEILRNKLLKFRFDYYFKININKVLEVDLGNIEPRLKQATLSFASLFANIPEVLDEFKQFLQEYQKELIEDRGNSFDGQIINTIAFLLANEQKLHITPKDIASKIEEDGFKVSPAVVGKHLKGLGIKTKRMKIDGLAKNIIIFEKCFDDITKKYISDGELVTACRAVTAATVVPHAPQIALNKKSYTSPHTAVTAVTAVTFIYEFIEQNPECSFSEIKESSIGNKGLSDFELDEILKKMKIQGQIFEPKTDKFMVI